MRPTSAHLGVPRRRHLAVLSALFLQVLKLCERAGLVKLGHVALDGTGGSKGSVVRPSVTPRRPPWPGYPVAGDSIC